MWWLILLIPLVLLILLLFLKVKLCLVYENELSVKVKVLLFNIVLFPKQKKKLKSKNYSLKNLQKKQNKLNKKSSKKKDDQSQSSTDEASKKKDKATQVKDILELVKIILENVMSPFGRYLKIEIVKIHIRLGADDPAKTAVIYGAVSQSLAYIIELFSNITNIDVKKRNSITVHPDFLEGKTEAKINITLALRVWHALSLAIKFFMGYLKKRSTKNLNQTTEGIN